MPVPLLRQATAEDTDFIYAVYEATARHLVEGLGRRWAEQLMREKANVEAVDGVTKIVVLGEQDIGFYCAALRPTELWLESLFLLPEHQGMGLGKQLLGQALSQARAADLPLRCQVMSYNPAIGFYLSQGLFLVKEESNSVFLESSAYQETR
ncbi:MAG: hypothetical protein CFE40_11565 [Burkholderiales bacterium PBB1]|nr:MAG: hypothetical protein CFE40_11565 [Burkholderiales bacterium PBB1]